MAQVLLTLRPKSPLNTKHEETRIMLGDTSIITQNGSNKQQSTKFTPEQTLKFLNDKITEYSALVEKQKAELKHNEVLLKGFITWQQEIQRKAGQ